MENIRLKRIESEIMKVLSEVIAKRLVRDPRVNPLTTIVYAKVSPDLQHGVIGVSGYMSKTALKKSIIGLNNAAGFLQSYICSQIRIRTVPHLSFRLDKSLETGFNLVHKIEEHATRTNTT